MSNDTLIERLRKGVACDRTNDGDATMAEAAAALVGLAKERDEARAVISACHEAVGEDAGSDDDTLAEGIRERVAAIGRLKRENAELREALQRAALEKARTA